jgi:hypothetical protein
MKKILLVLIAIFISVLTINVHASQAPYRWSTSNGSDLPSGAAQTIDGKTVTLKLNNYNGTGLKLECLGTAQEGMQFIIELTGENTITDSNIGLNKDLSTSEQFIFKGNGSLTINAPKPISYESYENTVTIKPTEENTNQEEIKEPESDAKLISKNDKTKKDSKEEDKDYKIMNIAIAAVFGLYILISLIFIILLITRIQKK